MTRQHCVPRLLQCFASVPRKIVFHINCCASHHCVSFRNKNKLTCRFQINWFVGLNPHAKNKIEIPKEARHCNPPFKQKGVVRRRAKTKNNSTPATQFPSKHAHASRKQKVVCCLVGFMQKREKKHATQGSFLPARTAAKMAFASSLLYAPVFVQLTSFIPAC